MPYTPNWIKRQFKSKLPEAFNTLEQGYQLSKRYRLPDVWEAAIRGSKGLDADQINISHRLFSQNVEAVSHRALYWLRTYWLGLFIQVVATCGATY